MAACALAAAGPLLVPAAAGARAGSLDRSFGVGGIAETHLGSFPEGRSVAIGPRGRIVLGGNTTSGATTKALLARFERDGMRDRSFANGGRMRVHTTLGYTSAESVAVDPHGKIVTAGPGCRRRPPMRCVFLLARYLLDGSKDRSFGHGRGRVSTDFGNAGANAVALDSKGRIVAGGTTDDTRATGQFALARYKRDGDLDPSFGDGGEVITDFGGEFDTVRSLGIDSRGRIVAVGTTTVDSEVKFALARYRHDGSLDRSFGHDGLVTTAVGEGAESVAIDSADRPVVAGNAGPGVIAVARYRTNGGLDRSFARDGLATTDFGKNAAHAVAIDSRGRIVVVGGGAHFALARYRRDGRLDQSFGGDGKVRSKARVTEGVAHAVAIDSHDRILAAGSVHSSPSCFSRCAAVARFVGYRRG